MRFRLCLSNLAVAFICGFIPSGLSAPSFDPKIRSNDLVPLQRLLAQYSSKLGSSDLAGAWSLLSPTAIFTLTNKILGGTPETVRNQAGFVALHTKASFGGHTIQTLTSVVLRTQSPFSVELRGTVRTDKGPVPNTPVDFLSVWTFSGDHPGPGLLVSIDDQITGFSSTSASPSLAPTAPTPGSLASQSKKTSSVPASPAQSSNSTNPSEAAPSPVTIDGRISSEDATTLKQLFNNFAKSVKLGKFEEASSVFSPGVRIISRNKLVGGSPETISGTKAFVKLLEKNFFGSSIALTFTSVTLKSSSPFTVSANGLIMLDKGPLPNKNIEFNGVFTFPGSHPAAGQLTNLELTVVGISKDPTSPSKAESTADFSNTTEPITQPSNSTEISPGDATVLKKLFNGFAQSISSGNFEDAFSVFSAGFKMISTNKLLGSPPETISDKQGFVTFFKKNSYEGRLDLSFTSLTLQKTSPFTVTAEGVIRLSKGPLPNRNIDFSTVFTFSQSHPALGQLQKLEQTIVAISNDTAVHGLGVTVESDSGASGSSASDGSDCRSDTKQNI